MARRCFGAAALLGGAIAVVLAGCGPGSSLRLVYPEQRHLDIREPAQIHSASLPSIPPPVTVSEPFATLPAKDLSLDEAIHIALMNSKVVRILAGITGAAS